MKYILFTIPDKNEALYLKKSSGKNVTHLLLRFLSHFFFVWLFFNDIYLFAKFLICPYYFPDLLNCLSLFSYNSLNILKKLFEFFIG